MTEAIQTIENIVSVNDGKADCLDAGIVTSSRRVVRDLEKMEKSVKEVI